jgi:hypothetical protein
MTTTEELNKVLHDAAEEGLDEEQAFLAVKHKGWGCVRPLVFWYYRHLCRIRVRHIEQRVDEDLSTASAPADRVRAREVLARETFALPDGTRVEWGEATEGQHLARAEMQRRLSGDCIKDAERHEQAAKEIRAAGVRCLNDLKKKKGAIPHARPDAAARPEATA